MLYIRKVQLGSRKFARNAELFEHQGLVKGCIDMVWTRNLSNRIFKFPFWKIHIDRRNSTNNFIKAMLKNVDLIRSYKFRSSGFIRGRFVVVMISWISNNPTWFVSFRCMLSSCKVCVAWHSKRRTSWRGTGKNSWECNSCRGSWWQNRDEGAGSSTTRDLWWHQLRFYMGRCLGCRTQGEGSSVSPISSLWADIAFCHPHSKGPRNRGPLLCRKEACNSMVWTGHLPLDQFLWGPFGTKTKTSFWVQRGQQSCKDPNASSATSSGLDGELLLGFSRQFNTDRTDIEAEKRSEAFWMPGQ